MKKLVFLLALSLFAASTALAGSDPAPNGIGIYFDLQGNSNCATPTPYTPLNAYVLATNITGHGISGWEATLLINPTSFPAGITMDIGLEALNVFTAPSFQVGYAVSRNGNPVNLLTITTFYLGGPIVYGIAPGFPSSFGGLNPGYADGLDPSILVPLVPSSNVPWTLPAYNVAQIPANAFVVAGANAPPCPVATESNTWGGVKDLYK